MHLIVKQGDRIVNEYHFDKGPIYIGRHTHSQVFLPDRMVSRQHAVIFATEDGDWVVEDLDSANKTYVNDEAVHKVNIENGDLIRISDFAIEVNFEEDTSAEKQIDLSDTLISSASEPQIIIRKADADRGPAMRLPGKRAKDFVQATEAICKANGHDEMLKVLLSIVSKQFSILHCWCALRAQSTGPMICHGGKERDGKAIDLDKIELKEKIVEAIEKEQFMLFPRIPKLRDKKIQSAMIAPLMSPAGCFGVIYLDNSTSREHYTISDLDYLMFLSIHTGVVLENF